MPEGQISRAYKSSGHILGELKQEQTSKNKNKNKTPNINSSTWIYLFVTFLLMTLSVPIRESVVII